jgi:hypothetical protein
MVFCTCWGLLISLVEIRERFSCLMNGSDETFLLYQVSCMRQTNRDTSIHNMMHSLYRKISDQNDERERINEHSSDADTHDDEVLCKPRLSSLLNKRRTSVRFLHVLPGDARQMIISLNQEADGVCPVVDIHAVLEAVFTPPPQIDISLYRHVRKKTRTTAVGTWGWRTYSFLAVSRLCSISPSKKGITLSSPSLIASSGQRDTASLWLFSWVTSDYADRATRPTCMSPLLFEQMFLRVHLISSPVSHHHSAHIMRRESQMLPQQFTASTTTDHCHSLIDRVLHLRRQLGIDIPLSMCDPEDTSRSPMEIHEASVGTPGHIPPAYDRRDWLTWEQSPCGGNQPEKG